MVKVLQINIFGNLSTGRIAVDLYRTLKANGHDGIVAFARNTIDDDVPYIKIGNRFSVYLDGIMTRLTDRAGFFSKRATKKLIKEIVEYDPDIIHLHNIHGYYINVEMLFEFLSEYGKPVVWTLHDCWAYTGHCCYYSMIECHNWKTGCYECPQRKAYPASFVDNSEWNYEKKRKLFTSIPNLYLVPVSDWLSKEVELSFLKDLPRKTIYNGIDISKFKPTEGEFRKKYNIYDKVIVLGVASTWDKRKGLEDFLKLSTMLDSRYVIVLVGVNNQEKKILKPNMIGISRTNNIEELAEIYTAADVFFNASVEETFGLPTVEAMACGTPAIVYNATALPEVIDSSCGFVVEAHDINEVYSIITNNTISFFEKEEIVRKASMYDKKINYTKYIDLYFKMCDAWKENN